MKLCDIIQAYTPTSGGIRTYITEKRRYMENQTDWEHCFIYPAEHDSIEHDGRSTICTVASPFIPGCEPYRMALSIDKAVEFLQQHKPDVIELGSGYVLPWAAFRYRKKDRPDTVITGYYHTDFPTTYVEPFVSRFLGKPSGKLAKQLAIRYARHVYAQCDSVAAPSPLLHERLTRYGIRNTRTIPLGVDLELFHPSKRNSRFRSKLGIRPEQLMLIYVGRLDSEKNVPMLIKSLDFLPNTVDPVLVLVGDGPMRRELGDVRPNHGRVVVHPYTTDKELLACLLASADIYVTAGAYETFGLSIVEAQASGLPVVGVNSGALKDRVTPGTGLLCAVNDPGAMAQSIISIIASGPGTMGMAARKLAEERYSWQTTFDCLFSMYRGLFNAKSAKNKL